MNSRLRTARVLFVAGLFFVGSANAQVLLISDFNSAAATNDGWQKYAGGDFGTAIGWASTGGVGGTGGLSLTEAGQGTNDYFSAPAKFLGNQSVFYGGTLSFDLKIQYNVTTSDLPEGDNVILTGAGTSLAFTLPSFPVSTGFTTYSLSLQASSGWYLVGTSTAPTPQQLQAVLGNLTDLRILGDWHNGPELSVLDNFQLTTVPEPATSVLVATGMAALGYLARLSRSRKAVPRSQPHDSRPSRTGR